MPLFVSLHRYTTPRGEATRLALDEHLAWNFKMAQAGRILMSGPIWDHEHVLTDDRQAAVGPEDQAFLGCIVFHAADLADAKALMAEEPFVKHGLRVCDVFEWEVHQAFGVGPFTRESLAQAHAEKKQLKAHWQDRK